MIPDHRLSFLLPFHKGWKWPPQL